MSTIRCPHCHNVLTVPDSARGKAVRCGICKKRFLVPEDAGEGAQRAKADKPPAPPPAAGGPPKPAPAPRPAPPPSAAPGRPAGERRPPPAEQVDELQAAPGTGRRPDRREVRAAPPVRKPAAAAAPPRQARVSVDSVVESLSSALGLKKLAIFWVLAILSLIVVGALVLLGAAVDNDFVSAIICLLVLIFVLGMDGVIAGGVAYLAHMERQHRPAEMKAALRFCLRRFPSLLGAGVVLTLGLLLAFAMVNGMVLLVNKAGSVGAFLAALLFLPQFVVNILIVLAALVGVLVPCAIAVEQIGTFRAIGRLISCLRRHAGQLMVQVAVTAVFGALATFVLIFLVALALGMTAFTNAPAGMVPSLSELVSSDADGPWRQADLASEPSGRGTGEGAVLADWPGRSRSPTYRMFPRGRGFGADWLRMLWVILIALAMLGYPSVYWIVAFTGFYESVRPASAAPPGT